MMEVTQAYGADEQGKEAQCAYLDLACSHHCPSAGFDTSAMCRVIDVLAELGVQVVSLGGASEEPWRGDFDEIINHASAKGLRVRLTSDGARPRTDYQRILASRVDEITIAVEPHGPAVPAVSANLRYLHNHLPAGKSLVVRVGLRWDQRNQRAAVLQQVRRRYPRATVKTGIELNRIAAFSANADAEFRHSAFAPPPPPKFAVAAGASAGLHS